MGRGFMMNGTYWRVLFVLSNSPYLIDRTGEQKLATTDPNTRCVYLSSDLEGEMLNKVLVHEIGHCVIFSYGLLDIIHSMVKPEYWMEAEESVCNFVANYGVLIFSATQDILGNAAPLFIPRTPYPLAA